MDSRIATNDSTGIGGGKGGAPTLLQQATAARTAKGTTEQRATALADKLSSLAQKYYDYYMKLYIEYDNANAKVRSLCETVEVPESFYRAVQKRNEADARIGPASVKYFRIDREIIKLRKIASGG